MIWLDLFDVATEKTFRKYFDTEFDRDKFRRKLRYSKKIKVIESDDQWH